MPGYWDRCALFREPTVAFLWPAEMLWSTSEESLCRVMVKWNTASVSQVSTLGAPSSVCDKVFHLTQSSNRLLTLQQAGSWFPTVQCTHLEAGSKQIMPKAKQLGTMGCGQRHRRVLCWFGPMCLFRDVRKDIRLVLKTASGPVSGNFLSMH